MRLRLYGRAHCHLCDEMAGELRALGMEFESIDIDSDPLLKDRYDRLVPVLTDFSGKEICHYRLDRNAMRAALENKRVGV